MLGRIAGILLALCLLLLSLPEAGAQPAEGAAPAGAVNGTEVTYRVGEGDVLQVVVYDEEDLSGSYPVHAGGLLNFPLVGRVEVSGLTSEQVAEQLRRLLAERFLVNPNVVVQVGTYGSQPVQVLGAVGKPGVFYLQRPTTVLEIIALAGGVVSEKSVKEVHLKRQAGGEATLTVLNLDALVARGQGNVVLQAGDVVNVVEGLVVYVSGQVEKSGAVPYREGLTVSRAIAEAGGTKAYANMREAFILRDGERVTFNLKRILHGRERDIVLQPGDQVVVQESVF